MQVKLINRSGNNRTYATDKGTINVLLCLDPNVYVNPGHYLCIDGRIPAEILSKRFSSGMQAVKAAYRSMLD